MKDNNTNKKKVLITGTAGFIGFHLANRLIARGDEVVGLDVINDYYDINVKYDRLAYAGIEKEDIAYGQVSQSVKHPNYRFIQLGLEDRQGLERLFTEEQFDTVVNLAAQAGVRYSLENPYAYVDSNIVGFINILEQCRHTKVGHLAFASSSSVYGLNEKMPLSTHDNVDHPVSLYAASKKSNELMAHAYSHLFGLPATGLRFFTVYGPWGRPDMALFLFTEAILKDEPIKVFNYGEMVRDFTYIDDIVEGVLRVLDKPATPDPGYDPLAPNPGTSSAPYRIFNIGNSAPTVLMDYITALEQALGRPADKRLLPIQPGDMHSTAADCSALAAWVGFAPSTPVHEGVARFVDWYRNFYPA